MLPAEIIDAFGSAEAAALRFVLLDAHEFGTCTRGLNHIAKAANCARRTVQKAIRFAASLALLVVAETPGKTHVITVVDARAIEWAKESAAYGQAHHPFGSEKNQQEQREEGSPHTLQVLALLPPTDVITSPRRPPLKLRRR
jgi:aspartyl-tRNA synthetase